MNAEYDKAVSKIERLSGLKIDYYEPEKVSVDYVLFKLCNQNLASVHIIGNMDVNFCYDWLYLIRVKELNELLVKVAELEKLKD